MNNKKVIAIVPSLNPDQKLEQVVNGLVNHNFTRILLVNDGSDEEHAAVFKRIKEKYPFVHVLEHEVNRGKGAALKTAFTYVRELEDAKTLAGIVTLDGDNQHRPEDVVACVDSMESSGDIVLGCRNFSNKEVPVRSSFGNKMTSAIFYALYRMRLSDTQTGLRAIPFCHLEDLIEVSGDRFEYETNMLLWMNRKKISFHEVEISTVYINDNESSHFNPLIDSWKIYKIIFKGLFYKKNRR